MISSVTRNTRTIVSVDHVVACPTILAWGRGTFVDVVIMISGISEFWLHANLSEHLLGYLWLLLAGFSIEPRGSSLESPAELESWRMLQALVSWVRRSMSVSAVSKTTNKMGTPFDFNVLGYVMAKESEPVFLKDLFGKHGKN